LGPLGTRTISPKRCLVIQSRGRTVALIRTLESYSLSDLTSKQHMEWWCLNSEDYFWYEYNRPWNWTKSSFYLLRIWIKIFVGRLLILPLFIYLRIRTSNMYLGKLCWTKWYLLKVLDTKYNRRCNINLNYENWYFT